VQEMFKELFQPVPIAWVTIKPLVKENQQEL
jgi:hypothetical protein